MTKHNKCTVFLAVYIVFTCEGCLGPMGIARGPQPVIEIFPRSSRSINDATKIAMSHEGDDDPLGNGARSALWDAEKAFQKEVYHLTELLSSELQRALASPPLYLDVNQNIYGNGLWITAVNHGDYSKIVDNRFRVKSIVQVWVQPYSACLGLSVMPDGLPAMSRRCLGVYVDVRLSLSTKNTNNASDWHIASQEDEAKYFNAVVKSLASRIIQALPACRREHGLEIICDDLSERLAWIVGAGQTPHGRGKVYRTERARSRARAEFFRLPARNLVPHSDDERGPRFCAIARTAAPRHERGGSATWPS